MVHCKTPSHPHLPPCLAPHLTSPTHRPLCTVLLYLSQGPAVTEHSVWRIRPRSLKNNKRKWKKRQEFLFCDVRPFSRRGLLLSVQSPPPCHSLLCQEVFSLSICALFKEHKRLLASLTINGKRRENNSSVWSNTTATYQRFFFSLLLHAIIIMYLQMEGRIIVKHMNYLLLHCSLLWNLFLC